MTLAQSADRLAEAVVWLGVVVGIGVAVVLLVMLRARRAIGTKKPEAKRRRVQRDAWTEAGKRTQPIDETDDFETM